MRLAIVLAFGLAGSTTAYADPPPSSKPITINVSPAPAQIFVDGKPVKLRPVSLGKAAPLLCKPVTRRDPSTGKRVAEPTLVCRITY